MYVLTYPLRDTFYRTTEVKRKQLPTASSGFNRKKMYIHVLCTCTKSMCNVLLYIQEAIDVSFLHGSYFSTLTESRKVAFRVKKT